ncbi:fimbrial biogenesis outer membrane usher protein [Kosakonia sacchari]|uniref:fimbria/pilus outer membrane usher protein n=1 Tax=Kosakonia sacchari TaxID=1158459 RepID=UPI0025B0145B|nr:fimbria/pilus outer membrane usher protein [Kosakonia sacchari]MDN2488272.1 fimbrial biogenesis outer membrane usher protein [Kosakonia sacchari]
MVLMHLRSSCFRILIGFISVVSLTASAKDNEFYFDSSLLRNSGLSNEDLQRLNKDELITPGRHSLDIYLNGKFTTHREIEFSRRGKKVEPCLPHDLLTTLGFNALSDDAAPSCYWPDDKALNGITRKDDMAQLRMDFTAPQALLKSVPRGSVSEASLSAGESMLFLNYMANQYHVESRQGSAGGMDSTWLSFNGGINLGLWRYRQQSNFSYSKYNGSRWSTSRRYIQRAIYPLRSEVLIGEGYTNGQFFSGMSFRGFQISSDTRMLPNSQRGYAPVVRGIAKTNAKVTILQGKTTLYETTVAPGPFTINDLYPTNFAGDLTVVVSEADGSENTFSVPFSALAESMRPGASDYVFTVGRARDVGDNNVFSEAVWRQGLTNALTLNLGNQLAAGYMSYSLGAVYSSAAGAFGLNSMFSRANMGSEGNKSGWTLRANYSKFIPRTGTSFTLAGYRYSTEGYSELYDALGSREARNHGQKWQSLSWKQRSRIEISAGQRIGVLGDITLSASSQDYRDGKKRDKQLQFNWSKTFNHGISLNLGVARTYNVVPGMNSTPWQNNGNDHTIFLRDRIQTMWSLSVSVPLGSTRYAPILSASANRSNSSNSRDGGYQSTLSGVYGEQNPLNYNLNYSTDSKGEQSVWGGGLQRSFPYANAGLSWSSSKNYWQASGSLQGALVAHKGGVTLGHWVGDSFVLVDAPGAKGAEVIGGQGARIDAFGYAIAPSLGAYQFNNIGLDPRNMSEDVELQTSLQRVAPYAGATVRVRFNTLSGQAMLITAQPQNNTPIPMGSAVYDSYGNYVGMVGQANQIYLRSGDDNGTLRVQWGNNAQEICHISWRITPPRKPLLLMSLPCR